MRMERSLFEDDPREIKANASNKLENFELEVEMHGSVLNMSLCVLAV